MTGNPIAEVLRLQSQRISRLQQSIDRMSGQLDALTDSVARIHRETTRTDPTVPPKVAARALHLFNDDRPPQSDPMDRPTEVRSHER